MLGIPKHEDTPPTPPQHPLSPLGEACSRVDLTAIHQILVMTHYRDDEGTNEVVHAFFYHFSNQLLKYVSAFTHRVTSLCWYQLSFQEWTQQMKDMLDARKRGDFAFRDKDFKTAIDCYTQVV